MQKHEAKTLFESEKFAVESLLLEPQPGLAKSVRRDSVVEKASKDSDVKQYGVSGLLPQMYTSHFNYLQASLFAVNTMIIISKLNMVNFATIFVVMII